MALMNVHSASKSSPAARSVLPAARSSSTVPRINPSRREGPLSPEEEHRLARLWRVNEDTAALGRLVAAHMGLVIRIAMEFRHSGPALEDLIQEGNMGLTIAARRFDPN